MICVDNPQFLGLIAYWHHKVTNPKGRVVMVHGLSEHSGRHLNTARCLVDNGYEVVQFDLRGSGQSGGKRMYIDRFEDYVEDLNQVVNWCHRALPPQPTYLLGHSLGGAISIFYASERWKEFQGLILTGPAFLIGNGVSPLKIKIGRLLEKVTPKLRLPDFSGNPDVSRDPKVVEAYQKDPLSCHFNTVRQGAEILDALPSLPERAKQIHCPVFICHGTSDRIITIEGSYQLLRTLGSKDKYLFMLPGGYHEPHNDLDKELYFNELNRWLEAHTPTA